MRQKHFRPEHSEAFTTVGGICQDREAFFTWTATGVSCRSYAALGKPYFIPWQILPS